MTPADIAAKLTQAQVRALRGGKVQKLPAFPSLIAFEMEHEVTLCSVKWGRSEPTPLGRAVLAVLDKTSAPKREDE